MSGALIKAAISGTSESVICAIVTVSIFIGLIAAPIILPIALIDGYHMYALEIGAAEKISLISDGFDPRFPHLVGVLAAVVTFGAYAAKQIVILRLLGVLSNVLLVSYSVFLGLLPIAILHSCLFPINLRRLYTEIITYTDVSVFKVISGEWPEYWGVQKTTYAIPAE